jgi:NADPH:quinone reductase-like Zn-dependent oxidoreductase
LAPGGHLVSTIWDHPGVTAEDAARTGVRFDTVRVTPSAPDREELGKLVEQGQIRVHVGDVLPLRDAATGHRMSETGRVSAKLVLVP